MTRLHSLILVAAFAGCFCIYCASPNQRWRRAPWPAALARTVGGALLALSAWTCLRVYSTVAALFVFGTVLMGFFCFIPYLGALIGLRRGDARENR